MGWGCRTAELLRASLGASFATEDRSHGFTLWKSAVQTMVRSGGLSWVSAAPGNGMSGAGEVCGGIFCAQAHSGVISGPLLPGYTDGTCIASFLSTSGGGGHL